jgi:hypothetical protein
MHYDEIIIFVSKYWKLFLFKENVEHIDLIFNNIDEIVENFNSYTPSYCNHITILPTLDNKVHLKMKCIYIPNNKNNDMLNFIMNSFIVKTPNEWCENSVLESNTQCSFFSWLTNTLYDIDSIENNAPIYTPILQTPEEPISYVEYLIQRLVEYLAPLYNNENTDVIWRNLLTGKSSSFKTVVVGRIKSDHPKQIEFIEYINKIFIDAGVWAKQITDWKRKCEKIQVLNEELTLHNQFLQKKYLYEKKLISETVDAMTIYFRWNIKHANPNTGDLEIVIARSIYNYKSKYTT